MEKDSRSSRVSSKMNTNQEIPVFSEAQTKTFFSDYTDSIDEALAVLDEENKTRTGRPLDHAITNKKRGS